MRVVFRKTIVVSDGCFDYLSRSPLQSQVKSHRQMMIFMPLVMVLIGHFCHVIDHLNIIVAAIGWLLFYVFLIHVLFVEVCWFCLRSCSSHL